MAVRSNRFAVPHPLVLPAVAATVLGLAGAAPALADVSTEQQTSMSLAGMNIDIHSVERTSADKQRRDTTTQCHGFLALFCHNVQSGEIVRLDRQLEWRLDPKDRTYTERAFPTPEQRAEAQQKVQETLEKMKQCPTPQSQRTVQTAPDTSHCQMSPPVLNVRRTDEHATLLGHDTRKTSVLLTQSCTDTQTGDVCEMDYGFDTWLTTDELPGAAERASFQKQYLAAQGLDPNNPQLQGMMRQMMAPYADQLKQLQSRASDFKGHPLKTTFYMSFGGPRCGKAKQSQQQQASNGGGASGASAMRNIAQNALRSGFGSLFHHGAGSIGSDSAGGAAASSAASSAADSAANAAANAATAPGTSNASGGAAGATPNSPMIQVVSLTTETTAIEAAGIPSDQFEIPPGWRLQQPKAAKSEKEFSCPAAGE